MTGHDHPIRVAQHIACHLVAAREMGVDQLAICVAMAAPAHMVVHHDWEVGRQARIEAQHACAIGARHGITHDEIYDRCSEIVDAHYVEILDLAQRLLEGK